MDALDAATVRVEAKFKNARLYRAIEAASVPISWTPQAVALHQTNGPVSGFCRFHGLNYELVSKLLNLRISPLLKFKKLRPICERLAAILDADVAFLFPAELYAIHWPVRLVAEVSHLNMLSLRAAPEKLLALPPVQDEQHDRQRLRDTIREQLHTLKPRYREVIVMRYGLDDGEEKPREVIAKKRGLTVERIRQMEDKALRQLRHPLRSRKLKPFLYQ